jgi:hypothetical protein
MQLSQVLHAMLVLTLMMMQCMIICLQDKSNGNQGGPTQRASALAALSSAFNPSSGKSSHLVNILFVQLSVVNCLSSFLFDFVGVCFLSLSMLAAYC